MSDVITIALAAAVTCIVYRGVNHLFDLLRDNRSKRTSSKRTKRGGKK